MHTLNPTKSFRLLQTTCRPGFTAAVSACQPPPPSSQPRLLPRSPGKQLLSTDGIHSRGIKMTIAEVLQSPVCGSAFAAGGAPRASGPPSPYCQLSPLHLQCQPLGTLSASWPPRDQLPPPPAPPEPHVVAQALGGPHSMLPCFCWAATGPRSAPGLWGRSLHPSIPPAPCVAPDVRAMLWVSGVQKHSDGLSSRRSVRFLLTS